MTKPRSRESVSPFGVESMEKCRQIAPKTVDTVERVLRKHNMRLSDKNYTQGIFCASKLCAIVQAGNEVGYGSNGQLLSDTLFVLSKLRWKSPRKFFVAQWVSLIAEHLVVLHRQADSHEDGVSKSRMLRIVEGLNRWGSLDEFKAEAEERSTRADEVDRLWEILWKVGWQTPKRPMISQQASKDLLTPAVASNNIVQVESNDPHADIFDSWV